MEASSRVLVDSLRRCLEPRPEILEAYLFGSAARGDSGPLSDVDVAVTVEPAQAPESPFGYVALLTTDLISALGTNRVDLVVLNEAPILLRHRVLRDGVRVFSRDLEATTRREGQALSRYCDWVCQLRKIEAGHRGRIEAGAFGR